MPAPYSYDLRSKAISAVKSGERKTRVCKMFDISRNTLDLWLKKQKETGNFHPVKPKKKGPNLKVKELDKFQEFVLKNQDKTQKQLAELWGNNLTQQNVSYACRQLNITRKKKLTATESGMNNLEESGEKN